MSSTYEPLVPDNQPFLELSDTQDAEFSAQPQSSPSINDNSHLSLSDHSDQLIEHETAVQTAKASLTFTNGLALVIGLQIGSGIFSAPSQVSKHVASAGSGVTVWFLAGLLVWTGAASFIELGLAIPKNGGVQEYLRHCYGDFLGFLFTWVWVAISKPSAMAMIAMVFSDHFCHAIFPATWSHLLLSKLVALFGLAFIAFINCLGARIGAVAANGFLVLKLFAVFSIVFTGIGFAMTGKSEGPSSSGHGWFGKDSQFDSWTIWVFVGNYVTALFGALFCYGGWETVWCHLSLYKFLLTQRTDWLRHWRYERPCTRPSSRHKYSNGRCDCWVCFDGRSSLRCSSNRSNARQQHTCGSK
jgi:amino acid permease